MVGNIFQPLLGGGGLKKMIDAINSIGAATSLVLCLDAGDGNSYAGGVAQQWTDVSGAGNHYNRGTSASADGADPTFNGAVNNLASSTNFSFDGADWFTPVATTTFDDAWHKDNATLTIAAWVYFPSIGSTFPQVLCNSDGTTRGVFFQLGNNNIYFTVKNETVYTDFTWGNVSALFGTWAFYCVSVNEAGGAAASHFNVNGSVVTFDGTYPTPTVTSPSSNLNIGKNSTNGQTLINTTSISTIAAWNRALSSTETTQLFNATRGRFNI